MQMDRVPVGVVLGLMVSLMAGVVAGQDLYIEQTVELAAQGGPAFQKTLMKVWVSGEKLRVDTGMVGMTLILRVDQKKMWMLAEAAKTYTERPLNPPAAKPAEAEPQLDIKATGNKKKIGEWNCEEHLVTIASPMPRNMQIWASQEVKVDPSVFSKLRQGVPASGPMSPNLGWRLEAIQKVGFPIQTIAKMQMGAQAMETTATVQKISQEKIDPALFELPEGYTKVEMPAFGAPGAAPRPPAPAPSAPK